VVHVLRGHGWFGVGGLNNKETERCQVLKNALGSAGVLSWTIRATFAGPRPRRIHEHRFLVPLAGTPIARALRNYGVGSDRAGRHTDAGRLLANSLEP